MRNVKSEHAAIIISCLILWFIWMERNNVIHRGATFNCDMVIERIQNHLQWVILARKMEIKQWKGTTPSVQFSFPPRNREGRTRFLTLLSYFGSRRNHLGSNSTRMGRLRDPTGQTGGGVVVRNDQGRILEGFSVYLDARSSVEAELRALLNDINMARKHGENLWIEVDAQEVVGMIERGDRGAAEHRHILTEIRNNLRGCKFKITHIQREGNKIADPIARWGRGLRDRLTFAQENAPPYIKALAQMDQHGVPNIRLHDGN